MDRTKIVHLLDKNAPVDHVRVKGWVRTKRDAKGFSFIELNDGSCLKNIQIIADGDLPNFESDVRRITTGSAISVDGRLVASGGSGQQWELQASSVDVITLAPDTFPLQKKRHTDEFLRTIAHLRPRTNKYGAAFRIRSELAFAVHHFFRDRGFRYIHTPIITGSDCEGAGELFRLTTSDQGTMPELHSQGEQPKPFFGQDVYLTVSGQLSVEMFALSLGDVYTFGPTFRAENSNTRRHAAEFWMIEPEMAFCNLSGNMDLAESFIHYLVRFLMDNCADDLDLFSRFVDKSLMATLDTIAASTFIRLPYSDAVGILQKAEKPFEYPVSWGIDLQTEHERYLVEDHFRQPVIVYDYPKTIKPFYMRVNDDGRTVGAMDVLVPGVGEIIGGSQREERYDALKSRMDEMGMDKNAYWWYLESRKYGSVEHSGFGLGFERLLMLVTGISNIRDVIPFPRTPGAIEF